MDATPTSTSRRRVVQGLAWAAPAVAMTAAAPAFAASCAQGVDSEGGPAINYGVINQPYTNQQLTLGAQVFVTGLAPKVTVTRVTEQWFVQNINGQESTGDGFWFMGNRVANWYKNGQCTADGCTVQWTGPVGPVTNSKGESRDDSSGPNPGWSSSVKNTQNNKDTVFSDEISRKAWDVTLQWDAPTPGAGMSVAPNGCGNFTTGASGRFGINYYGAATKKMGSSVATFAIITITLSNGKTLEYKSNTSVTYLK